MEKKYQVFVSSTYKDLVEERKKVMEILLSADCIPAGMESFVATDDEQFNVIKKVIDLCDYYVLIIGERYGTINPSTELSYTEMEYDYAVSKSLPILAFVIDEETNIKDKNQEKDDVKKAKLTAFKEKALKNRLSGIWRDIGDLQGKVALSIMKARQDISMPGWVRNIGQAEDMQDSLNKLVFENSTLQTEIKELKMKLINTSKKATVENRKLADIKVTLHFTEIVYVIASNTIIDEKDIEFSVEDIYKTISLKFDGGMSNKEFIGTFEAICPGYYVQEQQALEVKMHLLNNELIEVVLGKDKKEIIFLTEKGKKLRSNFNTK